MKRVIAFLLSLSFVFCLSGCVSDENSDIDTFLRVFNEKSPSPVAKEDVVGISKDGEISHCFSFGDCLICLNSKEENMKIFSADIISDKEIGSEFESAVRLTLSSLTTLSDADISSFVSRLGSSSDGFSRFREVTHDYTLSFVRFDLGSKFTVSFNSLVEPQTTNIPVTDKEFEIG